MQEETAKGNEDEIDLIDLFVVILRYRKVIISLTLISIIGVLIGFFIVPKRQFLQQDMSEYTVAELTVSSMPSVAKYSLNEGENLRLSLNKSDLFLSNTIVMLFQQPELIRQSLMRSGNEGLLISDDSSLDSLSIIEEHMVDLDARKPKSLSLDETNWIYTVKSSVHSLELVFEVQDLDKEKTAAFINSLYDIANETILDLVRPAALAELNLYQNLFDSESWDTIFDDILLDYANAKGILSGKTQPLIKISESVVEKRNSKTLADLKHSYITMGIIIIFAVFFISLFLVFILEFMHNIKNDEERMKKIRSAMGKTN